MKKIVLGLSMFLITAGAHQQTLALDGHPDISVSREEVRKAVEGLRTQKPAEISVGEFTYIETDFKVESSAPKLIAKDYFEIKSKYETSTDYTLMVHHDRVQYINGVPQHSMEDRPLVIQKLAPNLTSGNYFNLRKSDSTFSVPAAVLRSKDCGGLKDCPKELKTKQVDFDYEDYDNSGRLVRLHYTYKGSPVVPYMSSPVEACATGPYYANGFELQATKCSRVQDFHF